MSHESPTPIVGTPIVIDEAQLAAYPAWQRKIRRDQATARKKATLAAQKDEQKRIADLTKSANGLREDLNEVIGLDIPEDVEVDFESHLAPIVLHWQGYEWYTHKDNLFNYLNIAKALDVSPADLDRYGEFGLKSHVIEEIAWRDTDGAYVADALDKLEADAQLANDKNAELIASFTEKAEAVDVVAEIEPVATKTEYRYDHFTIRTNKPEFKEADELIAANNLAVLVDEQGWQIVHENTLFNPAGNLVYAYRFERVVPIATTNDEAEASAPVDEAAQAQADADELKLYDAALTEIFGDDDDDDTLADDDEEITEAEPIDPEKITISGVAEGTALHALLQGKPIAQAIHTHGVEAIKQALNSAIIKTLHGDNAHYEPLGADNLLTSAIDNPFPAATIPVLSVSVE